MTTIPIPAGLSNRFRLLITREARTTAVIPLILSRERGGLAFSSRSVTPSGPRDRECLFAHARPDPDLRYRSNAAAWWRSEKETAVVSRHGRLLEV